MRQSNRYRTVVELAPFAATALAGWGAVLVGERVDWAEYGASLAILAAAWSGGLASALRGRVQTGLVAGSLAYLLALALMRDSASGVGAGVLVLVMLPVLQTALHVPSARALAVVLAGVAVVCVAPLILVGAPEYPHNGFRLALTTVAVSSITGWVAQRLVQDIHRRASLSHEREQMLVRVSQTFQELLDGPKTRHDVCAAITRISGASVALLIEAVGEGDLRYTATNTPSGRGLSDRAISTTSAAYRAFHTGQRAFINHDAERHVGNVESWKATGAPQSMLYMPLVKHSVTIGVLISAWAEVVREDDPRVSVAELLARQMAVVIDNADVIDRLTDEAHTDPLTTLPNRRAWDERVADALADSKPLAVAMFDIDHFKDYNDSYGHPAGDRLLQSAASGWLAELRGSDFLARLGGEEFGLLLPGADRHAAETIVERLRSAMPAQETCSAGVTLRVGDDDAETLVARADHALYQAKADGRDRTVLLLGHGSRPLGRRRVLDLDI